MALAFCASSSERSPTEVGPHEASDLGRLAASLDALASLSCKSHAEEADFGDGAGEVDLIALLCGSPTPRSRDGSSSADAAAKSIAARLNF
jgi:hypothetical protein